MMDTEDVVEDGVERMTEKTEGEVENSRIHQCDPSRRIRFYLTIQFHSTNR